MTVGHADVLISLDSRLLKIDGLGDLAIDEDVDIGLDVDPGRLWALAGTGGRLWAGKLLQPLVKLNNRDPIDDVLELPGEHEYGLHHEYERLYINASGHTATRGIPLSSVESHKASRKKKYLLTKLRADDDGGDQTTFASVPRKDSLLLVENLRGRLGRDKIFQKKISAVIFLNLTAVSASRDRFVKWEYCGVLSRSSLYRRRATILGLPASTCLSSAAGPPISWEPFTSGRISCRSTSSSSSPSSSPDSFSSSPSASSFGR